MRRRLGRQPIVLLTALGMPMLLAVDGPSVAPAKPVRPPLPLRSLLLSRQDFGAAWQVSGPAPRRVPPLACAALGRLKAGRVAPKASLGGPTLAGSSGGPFVAQTVYRYASPAQQRMVWHALLGAPLLRCLAQSLVGASTGGVRFAVTGQRVVPAPRARPARVGLLRVTGTATQPAQQVDVYLDALVLADGPLLTEVSVSSFGAPPQPELERRVARRLARQLGRQ
jgi:hypothetical protein